MRAHKIGDRVIMRFRQHMIHGVVMGVEYIGRRLSEGDIVVARTEEECLAAEASGAFFPEVRYEVDLDKPNAWNDGTPNNPWTMEHDTFKEEP